ncbi:glycosaminoglycan attachment site [Arenibacter sp. BSSL-BM3]|uniref:Glycosaminoglycan attachment site n=1 Tax=Arenibacter arenosicollis TaxID=2762274 RepID=A0ABR7QTY1_9FLAO|nr:glycosaminoglycan attachment site [Arenibacter arenosicollis]MBC8770539.1 glycosaminoglycan attachment site [Arenibacter arenosicollis]
MKTAIPINKKLFDIYLLFTREPFVQYFSEELEFYSNGNGGLLGLISLDIMDQDYYGCILSRDKSKQYRAELVTASVETIEEVRQWIDDKMSSNSIVFHDNKHEYFDLFQNLDNEDNQHPNFKLLSSNIALSMAKETIKEVSYHYKDIDGNFIDQFQSINGFDSRVWELFLFCFFREQFFSFKRNYNAPDYMVEKFNEEIAVEAVIVSRKTELDSNAKNDKEIQEKLKNDVPLLFGNALFDKMKKKYWEKEHVKGKPFVIAIADFHDTMSMTWTFNSLSDYLYGYKYEHSVDKSGELIVKPIKIGDYTKPNGTKIPSGFFFQPNSENVSAIIFSSCGTLSKFNRMGKQAELGSDIPTLIRTGTFYNHTPNADKPNFVTYKVDKGSKETWSEGTVVYHNPNAKIPLNPAFFDDKVAQCFFRDKLIHSKMPKYFPYNSFTQNLIPKQDEEE